MGTSLQDLKRAVVLSPDDAQARYALAEALFAEGHYAQAISQLEKAVVLAPDDGNVRRLLARSYEKDGKQPRAQSVLEDMVKRDPTDAAAREELVGYYLEQGRIDDALVHAQESLKLAADDVKRHLMFAELLRRRHLNDRARAVLEAAQQRFPENAHVARDLKDVLLALGDEAASERVAGEKSEEYFREQAKAALRNPRLMGLVRDTPLEGVLKQLANGRLADASRALTDASEAIQGTALFHLLRGEAWLLEGRYDAAETHFRSALDLRADLGLAWNRLGDLAQMRHDLRGALSFYKKAILHGEDDANALEDIGDIYATLGERESAEKAYRRAIAKDALSKAAEKLASLTRPPPGDVDAPAIGRIGVLGWTPTGGAVSPLEAVAVAGKGELIFSGNVGPTGREAATVAFSVIKARGIDLGVDALVRTFDLHLHFTDTNIGKDGPSSGLALLLAGVSAYTQKPLRPRLAATGELTLHGHVQPVGGIHEKLVAAHLAGVRTVLMPRQNLKDARALPHEVTSQLELIFVDSVADAIARALQPS